MSYEMLQAVSVGLGFMNNYQAHQNDLSNYYAKQDTANRQYAANREMFYNNALHIGEEQMLAAESYSMSVTQLYKQIRSSKASAKAQMQSQGGNHTIGSGAARMRNISIQGSEALMRKDHNFQLTLNDFRARNRNNSMTLMNNNDKAYSGLSAAPNATGLILSSAGLAIDKYSQVGYTKNSEGKMESRWFKASKVGEEA